MQLASESEYLYLKKAVELFGQCEDLKKPHGCSEREIIELEEELDIKLPDAYKEYLRWMGKDYEGLFRGTDCFANNIVDNNETLKTTVKLGELSYNLPAKYIAFNVHQDYIVYWFEVRSEVDDPMCFLFSEGPHIAKPIEKGLFSSLIHDMVWSMIETHKQNIALKQKLPWWRFW